MRIACRLALVAALAQSLPAAAQVANLVADLTVGPPGSHGTQVELLAATAGRAFFQATSRDGDEVWISDGTAAGTELLADVCPGGCSAPADVLGVVNGITFWRTPGGRLVRSDGTRAGTYPLGGPLGDLEVVTSTGQRPVLAGGRLIFVGLTGDAGVELWRSDGSAAGTVPIADLCPGPFGSYPGKVVVAGAKLFFAASEQPGTLALYVMPLAGGAPAKVDDLPLGIRVMAATGTRVFFLTGELQTAELWISDGTAAGTRQVRAFPRDVDGNSTWLEAAGNRVLFVADDGTHGPEVWRSDGTAAGTMRLTNLSPTFGETSISAEQVEALGNGVVVIHREMNNRSELLAVSAPGQPAVVLQEACFTCSYSSLQRVGDRVLFHRADQQNGLDLWTTDGSAAGTMRIADACLSCAAYGPQPPTIEGGLFFSVDDAGSTTLRRHDGTAGGTHVIATLPAGLRVEGGPMVTGDRLFFAAFTPQAAYALWMTSTTTGISRRAAVVSVDSAASYPRALVALGDQLLFTAFHTGGTQPQLWTSRGSEETTARLTDVAPPLGYPTGPEPLAVAGDKAFFWIDPFGLEEPRPLWRSDGTVAGTFPLLADQRVDRPAAALSGELYYVLDEPDVTEVWKTDGTVAGTRPAFTLPAGVRAPRDLTTVGSELYFAAGSDNGTEVWRSDGTTAGVRPVTAFTEYNALEVGQRGFFPTSGGTVFLARESSGEPELWVTGGTPASTRRLAPDLALYRLSLRVVAGGRLYFFGTASSGQGLWRTDGTDDGTVLLLPLAIPFVNQPFDAVELGGEVFFAVDDAAKGRELWATDGTPAGTRLVADVAPGAASSSPQWLAAGGGAVYFSAHDGVHGYELWRSDGTAAGTRLVHDIAPGAASSYPTLLTVAGSRLYFAADDRVAGEELWALDLAAAPGPCVSSPTALCLGGHFRVEATWVVGDEIGAGRTVPLTADTGGFWFFGPENVEVVLKVLDGRPLNEHHWVFYGALSDVQYHLTVTDTETGLSRRYVNPAGELASVADTHGFGRLGAFSRLRGSRGGAAPRTRTSFDPGAAKAGSCAPAATRLCLRDGRFAVEATWKDFAGNRGVGTAVPLTGDTGWFWFFGPTNVEVILKVLDGTPVNGKHWVFYGALSSVEYTLRVTDTQTGAVKTYTNASGNLASVADTAAF